MIHLLVYLPFFTMCTFYTDVILSSSSSAATHECFHVQQLMESYGEEAFLCYILLEKHFPFCCFFSHVVTIKFYGEHLCTNKNTRFDLFYVLKNCGSHEGMSIFEGKWLVHSIFVYVTERKINFIYYYRQLKKNYFNSLLVAMTMYI